MRITSGIHKGRNIAVEGADLRPTSDKARQAIFNMLQSRGGLADKRVADICAGTGALGLEALSRGAAHACFVEHSRAHITRIAALLAAWKETRAELLNLDATTLPACAAPYDIVFIDPPYRQGLLPPILSQLHTKRWIAEDAWIIIEHDGEETIALPSPFTCVEQRRYGRAVMQWLRIDNT